MMKLRKVTIIFYILLYLLKLNIELHASYNYRKL